MSRTPTSNAGYTRTGAMPANIIWKLARGVTRAGRRHVQLGGKHVVDVRHNPAEEATVECLGQRVAAVVGLKVNSAIVLKMD